MDTVPSPSRDLPAQSADRGGALVMSLDQASFSPFLDLDRLHSDVTAAQFVQYWEDVLSRVRQYGGNWDWRNGEILQVAIIEADGQRARDPQAFLEFIGRFKTLAQDIGLPEDELTPELLDEVLPASWSAKEKLMFAKSAGDISYELGIAEDKIAFAAMHAARQAAREGVQGYAGPDRKQLADEIEADFTRFFDEHEVFSVPRSGQRLRLTFEQARDQYHPALKLFYNEGLHGGEPIKEALEALRLLRFRADLEEAISKLKLEDRQTLIELYGAKGANLIFMREVLALPILAAAHRSFRMVVPDFCTMPTTLYSEWLNGSNIEAKLMEFYSWVRGRCVMIRSSAVRSEDREHATGAGIHDSLELQAAASFREFVTAVYAVYESVNSERALEYRRSLGIDSELMGIVLQEYCAPHDVDFQDQGYINTVRAGVPSLLEVVSDLGPRPLVRKHRLPEVFRTESFQSGGFLHYQLHHASYDSDRALQLAAKGLLIEWIFGAPVQIEYQLQEHELRIFQVRMLPKIYTQPNGVSFPDRADWVYKGAAIGACDQLLDVLNPEEDNSEREGVVIFERNSAVSISGRGHHVLNLGYPKRGAVVVLEPTIERDGHLETLAVERGLACIFHADYVSRLERSLQLGNVASFDQLPRFATKLELGGHTRLRIVANGLEGRIYPPE
ncbi:MAG: PEP/pyruvate-binding domain-containing protein [Oligoflexia bacterium]|nr:PEP/pyruvate-binding domain-containing protein [Oligoflexia bacterium]